jgi:hypothetical protein
MLRFVAITTLILAGAFGIARADVYRWVDEHGEAHYSDRWVPGSELIKSKKPHPPAPDTSAARRESEQKKVAAAGQQVSSQLSQEAAARAVKQDLAKAHEQQCKEAKDRYQKAIEARRVYKAGKDGEREYMSDAETDSYRVQARNDVQQACGSAPK